jgi:hypothetical protein
MQISGDNSWQKTIVKHNTTTPQWYSDFTFLVTDPSLNSFFIALMDDDIGPDKSISSLQIPISKLGIGTTNASVYTFQDSAAKVRLLLQLTPESAALFEDYQEVDERVT